MKRGTPAYWIMLKINYPDVYARMTHKHHARHRGKIRQRARNWNRDNKARRNAQRRARYAMLKEK